MAIADIFTGGIVFKLRLIVYCLLIIFSFFIFIGVTVMKAKAKDYCPLYLEKKKFKYYYNGASTNCDYPIAVAAIFQLGFLIFRMITLILVCLKKLSKDIFLFSDIFEFIYVLIDLIVCFLTFVGACILSAGSNWELKDYPFKWRTASEVAQAGAWISTFLWLFIGVFGFMTLWQSGKIPIIGGKRQASTPPAEGGTQAEMMDPASERFGV